MKRYLSFGILTMVLLFSLMGCGAADDTDDAAVPQTEETGNAGEEGTEEEPKDDQIVLGIAVIDYTNLFHLKVYEAIDAKCTEQGIKLIATDAKNDVNTQIDNVESLIEQGCQAIFISIVDSESGAVFKEMTEKAGIPLIAVNTGFDEADYFIGTDDVQAGEMEAEAVAEALGGKGDVVILQGYYGTEATAKRTQGNENVLKNYPDINIIRTEGGSWDRAESMSTVETWINSSEKMDAIIANSDEPAIGAILALEAAGYEKIPVAGIDANDDALTFIKEERLLASVSQSPKANGETALEVALQVLDGTYTGDKVIYVDVELVTKENVDEYINE